MANIFKKIKTIDAVGDAPRKTKASKKPPKDSVRLGLKPVLKANADDMIDATDFQDPFGLEDESDLEIPEIQPVATPEDAPESKDKTIEDDTAQQQSVEPETPLETADVEPAADIIIENTALEDAVEDTAETVETAPQDTPKQGASQDTPKFLIEDTDIALTSAVAEAPVKRLHLHPIHDTPAPQTNEAIDMAAAQHGTDDIVRNPSDALPQFFSDAATARATSVMPDYTPPTWPYWVLGAIGFLWLVASAAAAYGYFELGLDSLSANPIHALGFVGFVLVPACLLFLSALLLKRLNSLSQESKELAFLNKQLLSPTEHTGQSAARLADDITRHMDRIEQRADQAFNHLTTVQSAFSAQIDDAAKTLTASAQQQTALDSQLRASKDAWSGAVKDTDQRVSELSTTLDSQLRASKTAWAGAMKETDDSISGLSKTLDSVIESFQARIDTTHKKMSHLSGDLTTRMGDINEALTAQSQDAQDKLHPLIQQAEQLHDKLTRHQDSISQLKGETAESLQSLDAMLIAQSEKLEQLNAQQGQLKSGKEALNAAWDSEDNEAQDRLFRHISQIDALNDRTDGLIKKIDQAADRLAAATQKNAAAGLRGTVKEEQLSLLPGLGAAKDMLPSLLTPEDDLAPALLPFDDIDTSDFDESLYRAPQTDIPQPLASQRVFGAHDQQQKQSWFKRFGRRATDPVMPQSQVGPVSAAPAAPPPQPRMAQVDMSSLRDKLIAMQLSPDALIDSGSVQAAAQLRMKDGPFAMSRYMATHLGAAIDYLRGQLPDDPVLRRQVYDMAAAFPLREQLDEKNEDMLIRVFETEAGREYLLCDAALNG